MSGFDAVHAKRTTAKLLPLFRVLPALLVAYGIVMTIMGVWEVRVIVDALNISTLGYPSERVTLIAAVVRSFDPLFFFSALAALTVAAVTILDTGTRA